VVSSTSEVGIGRQVDDFCDGDQSGSSSRVGIGRPVGDFYDGSLSAPGRLVDLAAGNLVPLVG
jgi:hypothetical protein